MRFALTSLLCLSFACSDEASVVSPETPSPTPTQDASLPQPDPNPPVMMDGGAGDAGTVDAGPVVLQNTWGVTPIATSSLSARYGHTATWTGSSMFVWGGQIGTNARTQSVKDGALYDPATQQWKPIADATGPRTGARAVWVAGKVYVWGGIGPAGTVDTGMVYDMASNTWSVMAQSNPPAARGFQMMVAFGNKIFMWGGYTSAQTQQRADGAIYDIASTTWTPIPTTGAPTARQWTHAVWTGSKILTWGACLPYGNSGAQFDPAANSWLPMNTTGAPSGRCGHSLIWTGSRMIAYGGSAGALGFADGGSYDPATDAWTPIANAPSGRVLHTAVWTGQKMLVWGGFANFDRQVPIGDGFVYE